MEGRRLELAATAIPLVASLPAVPARGGEELVRRLFEPLGYDGRGHADRARPGVPGVGHEPARRAAAAATVRLAELLTHLYVLLPVLDDEKHYWVGDDEVEKLLRRGEGWLAAHPERELIARRYLKHERRLCNPRWPSLDESASTRPTPRARRRSRSASRCATSGSAAVQAVLQALGARRVLDLGCGPGALLERLVRATTTRSRASTCRRGRWRSPSGA